MDKLRMASADGVQDNIKRIEALFPDCVTETINADGKVVRKVDFDKLQQNLSDSLISEKEERYQFTWPDKKKAILLANAPVNATLRPCREESVDFDNTENLYIEGDNLDVLKCLKETYLHKVKMIYIDPPYNTGNDFVYEDDFASSIEEYKDNSGQYDEQGNRLFTNTESNGRFHTDWLNMIYPRLKVARDLLTDDGVIFISISEEEIENLKKVCDEIFGESCFVNTIISRRHDKNLNRQFMDEGLKTLNIGYEYILCYSKGGFMFNPIFKDTSIERASKGYWKGFWNDADRPTMRYDILGFTPTSGQWKWKKEVSDEAVINYQIYLEEFSSKMTLEDYWEQTGRNKKFIRRNPNGKGKNAGVENWIAPSEGILRNTNWTDLLTTRNDETTQGLFDFPKNVDLINLLLKSGSNPDSLILDFFSGSATTAHAVMQLNAEDGGNRKYIMVQLPEQTEEKSEAYKAGYKNICEIGKERIRRAGKKIVELRTENLVDSLEKEHIIEKYAGELSEIRSLEEVYGPGGDSVSLGKKTPQRGNLCTLGSDETGSGFNTFEHCRGTNSGNERVYPFFESGKGLTIGTGNTIVDMRTLELLNRRGYKISDEYIGRDKQNDLFSYSYTSDENLELRNENLEKLSSKLSQLSSCFNTLKPDIGFRVLKLDSTNMQDIYYSPADTEQADLFNMIDNVKADRTPEDLLFQVMLELGATLDSKIERETIAGKTVFNVADGFIVACFDTNVSDKVVTAISKKQPLYAVIRDTSMANDSTATNFEQIFKTYSPNTTIKIL